MSAGDGEVTDFDGARETIRGRLPEHNLYAMLAHWY